jgi:hypothetical protein
MTTHEVGCVDRCRRPQRQCCVHSVSCRPYRSDAQVAISLLCAPPHQFKGHEKTARASPVLDTHREMNALLMVSFVGVGGNPAPSSGAFSTNGSLGVEIGCLDDSDATHETERLANTVACSLHPASFRICSYQ